MPREAASERPRGRRPVFSEDELRHAAQFAYARRVRTRRGAQDLVYRKFAVAVIELYREAHPVEGAPLEWLLRPMPRYSLLSELGRVGMTAVGDSPQEAEDLYHRALEVLDEEAESALRSANLPEA